MDRDDLAATSHTNHTINSFADFQTKKNTQTVFTTGRITLYRFEIRVIG